ncbi:hypothetical protein ACQ4PT_029295 [Festuca glaucescens]
MAVAALRCAPAAAELDWLEHPAKNDGSLLRRCRPSCHRRRRRRSRLKKKAWLGQQMAVRLQYLRVSDGDLPDPFWRFTASSTSAALASPRTCRRWLKPEVWEFQAEV